MTMQVYTCASVYQQCTFAPSNFHFGLVDKKKAVTVHNWNRKLFVISGIGMGQAVSIVHSDI